MRNLVGRYFAEELMELPQVFFPFIIQFKDCELVVIRITADVFDIGW